MYKFTIDKKVEDRFKEFLEEENYILDSENTHPEKNKYVFKHSTNDNFIVKIECKHAYCLVDLAFDDKAEIIKFHRAFLKMHNIKGNVSKDEVKEPRIAVVLVNNDNRGHHFNYLMTKMFFDLLNDNQILFSRTKIKIGAIRYMNTNPAWITKSDFKKVEKILDKSSLKNRPLQDVIHNLLDDI